MKVNWPQSLAETAVFDKSEMQLVLEASVRTNHWCKKETFNMSLQGFYFPFFQTLQLRQATESSSAIIPEDQANMTSCKVITLLLSLNASE